MDANRNETLTSASLFDVALRGSVTDLRNPVNVVRHLLWQVGPFQVDIRIESTTQSDQYKVAGMVVHANSDSEPQPDITVSLFSADNELARTRTDQHGEFSIEHRQTGKLQVRLAFSDEIYASVNVGEGVYCDRR